jgi:hypothetical protein
MRSCADLRLSHGPARRLSLPAGPCFSRGGGKIVRDKWSRAPEQSVGARVMFEFGLMFAILLAIALVCELALRILDAG